MDLPSYTPDNSPVPDGVIVRKVDLGQELQILAYYEQRKSEEVVR